jgi:hypothetical protein
MFHRQGEVSEKSFFFLGAALFALERPVYFRQSYSFLITDHGTP